MGGIGLARIVKEPKERKQEILDTAIALFCEKGYEKTSMADIALKMKVAQGLCYRYFPSKEALVEAAVEQYAERLASQVAKAIRRPGQTWKEVIMETPVLLEKESENEPFHKLFHGPANGGFHAQLSLKVCEKLRPAMQELLKQAVPFLPDVETTAAFCIYGQLGVLLRKDLSEEEKENRIREFFQFLLKALAN